MRIYRRCVIGALSMEIDQIMHDAYSHTRVALADHPARWLALIVIGLIPFVNLIAIGYFARILRGGDKPADLDGMVPLFVDGLRLAVASVVYWLVMGFILLLFAGGAFLVVGGVSFFNAPFERASLLGLALGVVSIGVVYLLVVVASVVIVAVTLVYLMALVHAARTESIGRAFAIGEILEQIHGVGWFNYLSAILVLNFAVTLLVYFVVGFGLLTLGIGLLLVLPLLPALGIFSARYLSRIYDGAPAAI